MATEFKGETLSIYLRSDYAEGWKQAAEQSGVSVAKWGAEAIEQRLRREGRILDDGTAEKAILLRWFDEVLDSVKDKAALKAALGELVERHVSPAEVAP